MYVPDVGQHGQSMIWTGIGTHRRLGVPRVTLHYQTNKKETLPLPLPRHGCRIRRFRAKHDQQQTLQSLPVVNHADSARETWLQGRKRRSVKLVNAGIMQ